MVMSLNMAYPCWDAPLPIILSKQLIACQARTRCEISFTSAVRSIFLRVHQHLIQRILQKLHDLLQKVHVQSRSEARKLKCQKGDDACLSIRRRVCCDQKLISRQFLRSAIDDARNVALLCGLHGSNLTKNPVMIGACSSACFVSTWLP